MHEQRLKNSRLNLSSEGRSRRKTSCLAIIHCAQLRTTWWHQVLKDDTNAVWRQCSTDIKGWGEVTTGTYLQTWPPQVPERSERLWDAIQHISQVRGKRVGDTSRVSTHCHFPKFQSFRVFLDNHACILNTAKSTKTRHFKLSNNKQ